MKKKATFFCLYPLLFVSCATTDSRQEAYERSREELIISYAKLSYAPACSVNTNGILTKNTPCPPMLYLDAEPAFNLQIKKCLSPKTSKRFSSACSRELVEMANSFNAKLHLRYKYVDWTQFNQRCTANPIQCQSLIGMEAVALELHNDFVGNKMMEAVSDYDRAYAQQLLDERFKQQLFDKLDSISTKSRQPTNANCTANPNYVGGYTIQCH